MAKRTLPLPLLLLLLATCTETPTDNRPTNPQSVAVLTQHNDDTRSGWNDKETALTTSNVNVQQFGAVFTLTVDDQVYAQPLVVGHISVGGGGDRNVVYIATVNNTLYANDGDDGTLYWKRSFTAPGMRPPSRTDMTGACGGPDQDFSGNIGIVGTPVIDAARGTMYSVARSTTGSTFVQSLHAVNIVDGNEIAGSPTAITATYSGNGDGSVNGVIAFDAQRQNQRQGLTLLNGLVYVTFSSHCDWGPYHGWILGYDAATLQQQVVYNATPNGYAGGMWESGTGMAADAQGNLYVVTGNGTVGDAADPTSPTNRAESALKLTPAGSTLRVASYFTPYDYQYLNDNDLDYGGMGGFLIPNSGYYVTGSKDGTGILWASYAFSGDAEHNVSPGILRAFDANDVTKELWDNRQNVARDGAGNYAKFSAPTIANGHVYLPTFSNRVVVYGLR